MQTSDITQMKDVLLVVFQMPSGKWVALKRTGANMLNKLSQKMIPLGQSVQEDIRGFLDFVISGFEHKHLLPPCARAFRAICIDHHAFLAPFAFEIIDKGRYNDSINGNYFSHSTAYCVELVKQD